MPALPPVPQIIRVDLVHHEAGDLGLSNRYFMGYTGTPPADSDLIQFTAGVAAAWATYLAPLAPGVVTLTNVIATDLSSDTAARGEWTGAHQGSNGGAAVTENTCVLLNFHIRRRYRGGKPRMYAPWGAVTDLLNDQQWLASFTTLVDTSWANFITNTQGILPGGTSVAGQYNVGYYHGVEPPITLPSGRVKQANKPLPGPIVPDPITSHATSNFLGTQRRRIRA
jgi:hypothetical protein